MISPTQRSLAYLRRRGAMAEVVERWLKTAMGGFRRDLFNFADVLAVEPGVTGVLAVQCCRTDDQAAHLAKIRSERVWPKAKLWLEAKNRIVVMGWARRGEKQRWTLSETGVEL